MGAPVSKPKEFMERRERSNTEYRRQGSLAMNLVREEFNRDIREVYDLRSGKLLGKGGFGTVRVVTHRETKNKYALKTIELKDVETIEQYDFLVNEINIMKKLDHPNIARVQEVYHTPDHYYMVMDLYTGGDMYARYQFRSEEDTAKIVSKLINALRYCHDRNVAHRDIKLDNICFESMEENAEVKLVDFGLSASFKDEQMRHDLVGSWAFMAPEVLQRAHHPQACDLWSMGVITYCLLVGFPPFRGPNLKTLKHQIQQSVVSFVEEPWKNVSPLAKDFISKLLKKDPKERLTAQEAQQHPWLTGSRSNGGVNATLSPRVVENLMQFKNLNLMKRLAWSVVARTLDASQMRDLEQEFHKADIKKSGVISIEDFRAILLRSNQFQRKEIDAIFEGLDIDSSGMLSYTDFTAAALDRQTLDTRRLKYAFERLDHDSNGEIDYEDLINTVGSDLSSEDVRTAIKQFDSKGNGKVDFDDFCRGMRSTGGPLDALSTAQLTSGYMVERSQKGEGVAAIQTLAELEMKRASEAAVASLAVSASDAATSKIVLPVEVSGSMERASQEEGLLYQAGADVAVPGDLSPQVAGGAAAAVTVPRDLDEDSATALSEVSVERQSSVSSSTATAAMSRPQSLELNYTSAASPAIKQVTPERINLAATVGSRPKPTRHRGMLALLNTDSTGSEKVDATGKTQQVLNSVASVDSTSVGGGTEATAPAQRKWSKDIPPGEAGGRVEDPVVPNGWVDVTGVSRGLWDESMGGGLADLRMRNSIRLRVGLEQLGVGARGGAVGGGLGVLSSPSLSMMTPDSTSSTFGTNSTSSIKRPLSGVPLGGLHSPPIDSSSALPPLLAKKAPVLPGAETEAEATASQNNVALLCTGGELAAARPSGMSGGEPAEKNSPERGGKLLRNRTVLAPHSDLPPRDFTAGEVDLGWGADGLPPDLMSVVNPPSSEGSGNGSSDGSRSSKALRFGGVTTSSGRKVKGERERPKRGSAFCGLGAKKEKRGAAVPSTAAHRANNGEGIYRNFDDDVTADRGYGVDRRQRQRGIFCMPTEASGGDPPFWLKWMEGICGRQTR